MPAPAGGRGRPDRGGVLPHLGVVGGGSGPLSVPDGGEDVGGGGERRQLGPGAPAATASSVTVHPGWWWTTPRSTNSRTIARSRLAPPRRTVPARPARRPRRAGPRRRPRAGGRRPVRAPGPAPAVRPAWVRGSLRRARHRWASARTSRPRLRASRRRVRAPARHHSGHQYHNPATTAVRISSRTPSAGAPPGSPSARLATPRASGASGAHQGWRRIVAPGQVAAQGDVQAFGPHPYLQVRHRVQARQHRVHEGIDHEVDPGHQDIVHRGVR